MKQHKDKYGEYYWDRYPTRFWIKLPWISREADDECGHSYWSFDWIRLFPRKWSRRKIYTREDLMAVIKDINPAPSALFDRLASNTDKKLHEWARYESPIPSDS